jgi:hypothetical protein
LLSERDSLAARRAADGLLPSAQVFSGIGWGDGPGGTAENTRGFVGVAFDFGWNRPQEKARAQIARIEWGRGQLASRNRQSRRRELSGRDALLELAREREALTEAVLTAENEEYTYGRSDINDLIRALEAVQAARSERIRLEIERSMLVVEWRRVTDRLVGERTLEATPVPAEDDLPAVGR